MRSPSPSESPARLASTRGEGLFDFPLPIPTDSIYEALGIAPETPQEQIGWALREANGRRNREKSDLEARLKEVFAKVPGLEQAYAALTALRADTHASPERLRDAQERLSSLEKRATAIEPRVGQIRQQIQELARKIDELNALALDQPEKRKAYDGAHPPLALLKLAPATRDGFIDAPRTLLALLRREMTEFLRSRGEAVYYVSDLDRDDFTADFTVSAPLDD